MSPSTFLRSATRVLIVVLVGATDANAQEPEAGRTLSIGEQQIYVEEEGSGPPLLLLHFFGGCGDSWQPHREVLARSHRLIVPDLRGHGRSTNPTGRFSHRDAAADMFALLDSLGVDRFRAMGMSSGGMTLLHMATQQPRRVESMVLIGATTEFPTRAREIMTRTVPSEMSSEDLEDWGRCSARGEAQTREILGQFRAMKDSYDDMNFTSPYLGTITARTLIVHGDRDEFFPVEVPVEMYVAIPRASLWIVPDGGHIPIFGAWAEPFQHEVLRFLAADPGASRR